MLIHKQQTNLWMKLPTIPPRLAGKIVKYRPLWKPIILQDLKDSASSQAWKKNDIQYYHLAVRIRTCRAIFIFLLREKKTVPYRIQVNFRFVLPGFHNVHERHNTQSNSFSLKTVGDVQFWNIKLPSKL